MKNRLTAIRWAFSIAWKVDKKLLVIWFAVMAAVSIMPSVALYYKNAIIDALNVFVTTGNGTFDAILPTVMMYGVLMALIGLSNRLNVEFIYSVMYDKYYFGMAELLMDSVQGFSMEELLKKDLNDEYYAVVLREGSLTDVISGCCTLIGKFVGLGALLVVAFTLSLPVFCFSLIYIVGIVWLNLVYVEKQRYGWKKISENERLADHYEKMPYSPEYAKELRIFGTKKRLMDNWKKAYEPIYEYEVKKCLDAECKTLVSSLVFYMFVVIITIVSLFSVVNGTMGTASLLVIFMLCLDIFSSVSGVARMLILTDHGIYAIERQYRIFGLRKKDAGKSGKKPTLENEEKVFETKDLSYAYGGDKLALDRVSLTIHKGETIALVGANGSGKSTLVKLLLRLYQPLSGSLYFYGQDYEELGKDMFQNRVGAFFQDYYLFHMPIWENIGFGDVKNVDNEEKIDAALRKGGADQLVDRLPKGKETFVHNWIEKSGANFSGGESQKLAISRTHMSDKDILIFDEPASALDPIAELEQFMNIKEKVDGRTAILVSHRVGFARLADRIILMDKGRIAETGTHEELMRKNGLYAELFHAQAQWYDLTNGAAPAQSSQDAGRGM